MAATDVSSDICENVRSNELGESTDDDAGALVPALAGAEAAPVLAAGVLLAVAGADAVLAGELLHAATRPTTIAGNAHRPDLATLLNLLPLLSFI